MKMFLAVMFMACTMTAFSQVEIKLEEVKNHVGDSVKVRGVIKGIRYLESSKGLPTFINLGRPYPEQLLTIVIFQESRGKLGYIPTQPKDLNAMAVVIGKITMFNDRPQIVIANPGQLVILRDEEVPADQIPPIQHS